jgi:DICT domain-containing protein
MYDDRLTISELSEATGVEPATLRAWERRYGFPVPLRPAGGHRRYGPWDVQAVRRVLAERAAGATLGAAVARVVDSPDDSARSLFAALRDGGLEPRTVRKRTMTALSHAIEDECAARAERGALVGAFQERRFYARARRRWLDLALGARVAVAFADFPRARHPAGGPAEIPIAPVDPVAREWALVHLAGSTSAVLVGRELPGQKHRPDPERRFELVWSLEPGAAREGVGIAARLARDGSPEAAAALEAVVADAPRGAGLDPAFVTTLTNRMIGYLEP